MSNKLELRQREVKRMTKKLLTVEEVAEHLNVKKSWIYDRTRHEKMPHYHIGKYVRFDLDEIEEWIRNSN